MANQLAQNPMYIDTPSPYPVVKTAYKIHHIEYVGFGSATDTVVVQNANGRMITELMGEAAGGYTAVRTGNVGWVDGIMVPTLTAGAVLIFFE
jgi:hypothetical protein